MSTPNYGKPTINIIRFLINYVIRFLLAGIVLYSCWIPLQNLTGWFSWHVILCTFGYVPLMAESIMLFIGDELWSRQISRKSKYVAHGILISVGTGFTIVGNALVFYYIEPDYHLYTAHGITGLISMILLIISLSLGLAVNYSDVMKNIFPMSSVWYKLIHNFVGILGYAVGIISLCYAYYTNWFIYYTGEGSRIAALIMTIVVAIWTVNGALASAYNQIKSVIS